MLALFAVVGMTLKQLPGFAFRSATDYVVVTAGTYDILVECVAEDNDALLVFLSSKLRKIQGVRETETFVYLRLIKQSYQWGTR